MLIVLDKSLLMKIVTFEKFKPTELNSCSVGFYIHFINSSQIVIFSLLNIKNEDNYTLRTRTFVRIMYINNHCLLELLEVVSDGLSRSRHEEMGRIFIK